MCRVVAQAQPGKTYQIGFISARSGSGPWDEAFKLGLRDLGYVEGQNISVLYRWAEGKFERLPELAAELVRLKVDIIVTETTPAAQAAKKATQTIPIVMAISGDAVGTGLVESLAHPGGNVTGQSFIGTDLAPKWVELLHEIAPKASRLAFLAASAVAAELLFFREMEPVAQGLGATMRFVNAETPTDFKRAFTEMKQVRIGGIIVAPNAAFFERRKLIADLAFKDRLPAVYGRGEFVDAGGLVSYGVNNNDVFRRAATYVDKIIKGRKPADLPVERPTKFELVINLKAAKQIGLSIPPNVLARADRVIR